MTNTLQTLNQALGAQIVLTPDNFPGLTFYEKFARNPTTATSFEDIWLNFTNLVYSTIARTQRVDSTGNDNGNLSSGARKVKIEGLDQNWAPISEIVTTSTAVPPTTANTFIRVDRAYVTDVGTGGVNENDITITATTDEEVQAKIGAGLGQTEKSQVSVPAGKKMIIFNITASCKKLDDFQWNLVTREFGESWRVRKSGWLYQNEFSGDAYVTVGPKGDVKMMAKAGNLNSEIDASYRYILVDA